MRLTSTAGPAESWSKLDLFAENCLSKTAFERLQEKLTFARQMGAFSYRNIPIRQFSSQKLD